MSFSSFESKVVKNCEIMSENSKIDELSKKKAKTKIKCCIGHCKNDEPPLFPFPKNQNIRNFWEEATGKFNVKSGHIKVCMKHFSPDDLIRDLKSELLGLPLKPKLKPESIPHLNLSLAESEEKSVQENVDIPQVTKSGRIVKPKFKTSPAVKGKNLKPFE